MHPPTETATVHDAGSPPIRHQGRIKRRLLAGAIAMGMPLAIVGLWAVPKADIPAPGPNATPAQVVAAYVAAYNARDFDTSNAIDGRQRSDNGRFSRTGRWDDLDITRVDAMSQNRTWVRFTFTPHGIPGFESGDRQDFGLILQRQADGLWHIVDAGVV